MAGHSKRLGIGADLDSFDKARRAVGEDRADAGAIKRQRGDVLVNAGPTTYDALAAAIVKVVSAENEDITSGPSFKIESNIGRVMEVSFGTITCHLRFNPGAFADALGPRPPCLSVSLGPNHRIAAYDPTLKPMLAAVGDFQEPPVQTFDVHLITEDKWRINGDLASSAHLAEVILGGLARYYKKNAPPIRRPSLGESP